MSRFGIIITEYILTSAMSIEPETAPTSVFADDPPGDLLQWIAVGDAEECNEAARVIYVRYRCLLYSAVRKAVRGCGNTFIEELVLETFQLAFKSAGRFRQVENENPQLHENRFVRWLLVIAKNRFHSWVKKESSSPLTSVDDGFWNQVAADMQTETASEPNSMTVNAVADAMSELPERDADILRTYLAHCPDVKNPQSKLPRKIIDELCQRHGTTPENLRTILHRTKKRLREMLKQKGITQ